MAVWDVNLEMSDWEEEVPEPQSEEDKKGKKDTYVAPTPKARPCPFQDIRELEKQETFYASKKIRHDQAPWHQQERGRPGMAVAARRTGGSTAPLAASGAGRTV
jgi:hypothetical protein